jgi:transposase
MYGTHETVEGERRVLGEGGALDPAPSHAKGGRTRMDDRDAFAAMIYVLRTGIQWNALPRDMGASSTVHDRYQEWERAGFFEELWRAGLAEYDELEGIEWEWQAIDGAMRKAPFFRTRRDRQEPHRSRQEDGDEA